MCKRCANGRLFKDQNIRRETCLVVYLILAPDACRLISDFLFSNPLFADVHEQIHAQFTP